MHPVRRAPCVTRGAVSGELDAELDAMPYITAGCHQTSSRGACRLHYDVMELLALESAVVSTLGSQHSEVTCHQTGAVQPLIESGVFYACYKVESVCGAMGHGVKDRDWDGDVELHGCQDEMLAWHGNPGTGRRGALLRSMMRMYPGMVLLDHPKVGSTDWVDGVMQRHGYSRRQAQAAGAAGGLCALG